MTVGGVGSVKDLRLTFVGDFLLQARGETAQLGGKTTTQLAVISKAEETRREEDSREVVENPIETLEP